MTGAAPAPHGVGLGPPRTGAVRQVVEASLAGPDVGVADGSGRAISGTGPARPHIGSGSGPARPHIGHLAVADVPVVAYAAALLSLPGMWPARLGALLGQARAGYGSVGAGVGVATARAPMRDAARAWDLVRRGKAADVGELAALLRKTGGPGAAEVWAAHWAAAAARMDVTAMWASYFRRRIRVDLLGTPGYPAELGADRTAPYALFRAGAQLDLAGPCVAIVGTRRCTPGGREIATEFGEALAAAGVRVVSGLALGIDAAAHHGALAARAAGPIGVVAGGFDLPYPARHRALWDQVAASGVLVSEWPLGTRSEGWRFPARNRVIASIADAVVVVESRETGGSMITAEEAIGRGITVLAVPGSIRSPASAGTNRLLRDGVAPACSVEDVLAVLSIESAGRGGRDVRPAVVPAAAGALAAVGWEPTPTAVVVARSGLAPEVCLAQLARLERDGWIGGGGGSWQRVGPGRPR